MTLTATVHQLQLGRPSDLAEAKRLMKALPDSVFHGAHTRGYWDFLLDNTSRFQRGHCRLVCAYDDGNLVACVPFILFIGSDPDLEVYHIAGSDLSCFTRPPCPIRYFRFVLSHAGAVRDWCVDQNYLRQVPNLKTVETPGGRFYLPDSLTSFIEDGPYKARQSWRTNLRKNADLRVEASFDYRPSEFDALLPLYSAFSAKYSDEDTDIAERVRVTCELYRSGVLPPRTAFYLYVYEKDKPIAINISLYHEDGVVDTLCLRSDDASSVQRGLGIFCVLQNIEWAIRNGRSWYSLTPSDMLYKKQLAYSAQTPDRGVECGSEIDIVKPDFDNPFYYRGLWVAEDKDKQAALQRAPRHLVDAARSFIQSWSDSSEPGTNNK